MLDEFFVKEYFQKEGTVSKWWNPTKGSYAYLFANQLQIIKKWLEPEQKLSALEVSCGKGRAVRELSSQFEEYLATDISSEMLAIARQSNPNVRFELQDAENLNINSESKDVVICLEALVHYPNPEIAIKEFYRVLKPSGILIIDSDNKYSLRRLIKKAHQIIERSDKQFGEDIFRSYSKRELLEMIKTPGFKVEEFQYIGLISPTTIHRKDGSIINVINQNVSKRCHQIGLDKLPILNKLSTYHLVLARK